MKTYVKGILAVGALAMAMLAVVQMASAQAPRASDKARGYYGPAASPDPADATWLAPGVTGERMTGQVIGPARSFSYAPAPRMVQPAAPQATSVQPNVQAPATRAPAASAPARRYSYSYQTAPVYRGWRADRVLGRNPADRDAAAKAQGEY